MQQCLKAAPLYCVYRDPPAEDTVMENTRNLLVNTARTHSFPYTGQSINIFLPILEHAPGEESHYLNINSLCGLSCNKAGVRRC